MMEELEVLTGKGGSVNAWLNRGGEGMFCSPRDALDRFVDADVRYLVREDIRVVKDGVDPYDTVG